MEAKIRKRMRRIEAMARLSRMRGFRGALPGAILTEYSALAKLEAS